MSPSFPRAISAIFRQDDQGDLHFELMRQEDVTEGTLGYRLPFRGDSGAPMMTTVSVDTKDPEMKEERHTLVAVYNGGLGFRQLSIKDKMDDCPADGSEVTEDVIQWIKQLDQTDYSLKV